MLRLEVAIRKTATGLAPPTRAGHDVDFRRSRDEVSSWGARFGLGHSVMSRRRRVKPSDVEIDGLRRVGQTTVVIETRIETNGARDHVELADGAGFGSFEDVFHNASGLVAAALEEARGVGVAIEGIAPGRS